MVSRLNQEARKAGIRCQVAVAAATWFRRLAETIFSDMIHTMSLTEIKKAVRELSPKELAELAAFISKEDNAEWDKEMEEDAASGKLDFLFEEAERERAAGQLRDSPEKK